MPTTETAFIAKIREAGCVCAGWLVAPAQFVAFVRVARPFWLNGIPAPAAELARSASPAAPSLGA
jgi:hypothetical protein